MPISDELKAVYGSVQTYRYFVECLSLHHSGFDGGVEHITNQVGGWVGDLETGETGVEFHYVPFFVIPPKEEEQSAINLQVAIDNVSRVLMDELENVATRPDIPIILRYRVYLSDDPNTVQNAPPLKLDVASVKATQQAITFVATMGNYRRLPFPKQLYDTELFPGLAR